MNRKYLTTWATSIVLGASLGVSPAFGQDTSADETELEEIVVTAQRREQSVQDVSVSVVALSGEELQKMGAVTVREVAQNAPNITFNSYYGESRPDTVIRGIGTGLLFGGNSVAPVGYYIDEVFMGARAGQLSQMFDQSRIEILRGPQGTLFGRNTVAGAVSIYSNTPSDTFEGNVGVTVGRWNQLDLEGAVNVPLSDSVAVRVAGVKRKRDGWVTNVFPNAPQRDLNSVDNWAGRIMLRWDISDASSWILSVRGNENDGTTSPIFYNGGDLGPNQPSGPIFGFLPPTGYTGAGLAWDEVELNAFINENIKGRSAILNGTIKFGDLVLTSITGWDKTDFLHTEDSDGTPFAIYQASEGNASRYFSQELRLAGALGATDWIVGAYYYRDWLGDLDHPIPTLGYNDPLFAGFGQDTTPDAAFSNSWQRSYNYAGFADVRIRLSDRVMLGLGARYTFEEKESYDQSRNFFLDGSERPGTCDGVSNKHDWSATTGRAVVEFRPVEKLLTYVSASRGFKSGGLDNGGCEPKTFEPETVNTYEAGVKSTLLEGRLVANASVFYNDLKDSQALTTGPDPNNPSTLTFFTRNASSASISGAEIELRARPAERFDVSFGVGLLDAKYDEFSFAPTDILTDARMTFAPTRTLNAIVSYELPFLGGSLTPRVSGAYRSQVNFEAHGVPRVDTQGGYTLVDASIAWANASENIEATLWGRNLTDKEYIVQTVGFNGVAFYGGAVAWRGLPVSYGLTVRYNFD